MCSLALYGSVMPIVRHGGLLVRAIVFGLISPGSSPGRGHGVTWCCVVGQDALLSQCLSPPQVCKWVPTDLKLRVTNPVMDWNAKFIAIPLNSNMSRVIFLTL